LKFLTTEFPHPVIYITLTVSFITIVQYELLEAIMKTGIRISALPNPMEQEMEAPQDIDRNSNCDILTSKQVAQYLQMSPRTVYSHWEKLGGLKIGRTLRFRKEHIDALFGEESKKMERGGEKRKRKIYTFISDEVGSKNLGSRKVEGVGQPEVKEDRNRHGLVDSQ